eukprot:120486-Amphidinium_carterae.2
MTGTVELRMRHRKRAAWKQLTTRKVSLKRLKILGLPQTIEGMSLEAAHAECSNFPPSPEEKGRLYLETSSEYRALPDADLEGRAVFDSSGTN